MSDDKTKTAAKPADKDDADQKKTADDDKKKDAKPKTDKPAEPKVDEPQAPSPKPQAPSPKPKADESNDDADILGADQFQGVKSFDELYAKIEKDQIYIKGDVDFYNPRSLILIAQGIRFGHWNLGVAPRKYGFRKKLKELILDDVERSRADYKSEEPKDPPKKDKPKEQTTVKDAKAMVWIVAVFIVVALGLTVMFVLRNANKVDSMSALTQDNQSKIVYLEKNAVLKKDLPKYLNTNYVPKTVADQYYVKKGEYPYSPQKIKVTPDRVYLLHLSTGESILGVKMNNGIVYAQHKGRVYTYKP